MSAVSGALRRVHQRLARHRLALEIRRTAGDGFAWGIPELRLERGPFPSVPAAVDAADEYSLLRFPLPEEA